MRVIYGKTIAIYNVICLIQFNYTYRIQIRNQQPNLSMNDLSQIEAYKQLLQVTQNILNELSPQDQILKKYLTLKKSILSKVKNVNTEKNYCSKILSAYKAFIKNFFQCVTQFETQIQGQMNKSNFLRLTSRLVKQTDRQSKNLGQQLSYVNQNSKNTKLMMKQQLNSFKYLVKQFEGKIENMGLMIQVHRKMHQIILEASEKQAKTVQKQIQYNRRLNEMETVVDEINDVKNFIQSYDITQKKARKFQLARKNLAKILFDL